MQDAVIVAAVRTAVGKAPKGTLSVMRPDELAASVIKGALARVPGLELSSIDDVILGCAMPEGEQGLNVARIASLRAGIPVEASAVTVNRFCSSGLQAIAYGAERIMLGQGEAAVTGGTESMSMVPMGGNKVSPNPALVACYPDVYLTTGLVAENHARESHVSREAQDQFALRSHQRAVAAIDGGRFKDEIIPLTVRLVDGAARIREIVFDTDEGPRRDTSIEALAKLRPAFHESGTVTAGTAAGPGSAANDCVVPTPAPAPTRAPGVGAELGGNQPAVRHSDNRRLAQPGAVHGRADLGDVVLKGPGRIAGERTGPLVAQRERHHPMVLRQRLDGRTHPLPAALQAGDQHDRRTLPEINHLIQAPKPSVSQRLSGLERVLDAFQRLALAHQAHERFALEIQQVLLGHGRGVR